MICWILDSYQSIQGHQLAYTKDMSTQGHKYNIWITHTAPSPFWFWNVSRGEAWQFLIIKLMEHAFMVISAMLRGWSFTYRLFYRLKGLFGGKVPGLDKSYWGKTNVNMVKNKFFFSFFGVNLLYYSTITQKKKQLQKAQWALPNTPTVGLHESQMGPKN